MNRTELKGIDGMLFLYESPRKLSFWMKNTLIPLDILFFDQEYLLVRTWSMEPCESDPCKRYSSGAEAQYALEVPAGFVKQHGILPGKGWKIVLNIDK